MSQFPKTDRRCHGYKNVDLQVANCNQCVWRFTFLQTPIVCHSHLIVLCLLASPWFCKFLLHLVLSFIPRFFLYPFKLSRSCTLHLPQLWTPSMCPLMMCSKTISSLTRFASFLNCSQSRSPLIYSFHLFTTCLLYFFNSKKLFSVDALLFVIHSLCPLFTEVNGTRKTNKIHDKTVTRWK